MAVIRVQGVSLWYDSHTPRPVRALEEVSLDVTRETFLGIVGPSGCGKTSLLQVMSGLVVPDRGCVVIDGEDPARSPDAGRWLCRKVALVFQFPERQLFEATVFDDVAYGPRKLGLPGGEVAERVLEALEAVGLEGRQFQSRSPLELSFGEMRRAAIAGILALRPRVLLLDEPTAGLDERGRGALERLLFSLHNQGMGVVIASHDLAFLAGTVRDIVALDHGRVVLQDSCTGAVMDADCLRAVGVTVPPVARVLSALAERGWKVDVPSLRESEVAEALVRSLRDRS